MKVTFVIVLGALLSGCGAYLAALHEAHTPEAEVRWSQSKQRTLDWKTEQALDRLNKK